MGEINRQDLLEEGVEDESEILNNLHPDFRIEDGPWRYNRELGFWDGAICMKVRFGFDDAQLLDDCKFHAKIGINNDPNIPNRFIGFAYSRRGKKKDLVEWVKKFPFSELIVGLDSHGVIKEDSVVTKIEK